MTTQTLLNIRRNKINNADRLVSKLFPGASLTGFFVGGRPVASRGFLITPKGMDVDAVIAAADLKKA